MSQTVYAIASGKGGVGKTTTVINLGAMLADAGNDVVAVDVDLGMANLAGFLDLDPDGPTLHEVLAGDAKIEDAVYEAPGGVAVLPSGTDIEAFARSNTEKLADVVAALREVADYVLLDTGAGVSYDTVFPLGLADAVLLVSTPDVASVHDTAKTGDLTGRFDGTVTGAVLTKRGNNVLSVADVEERFDTDVLAVVPEDETVPMSVDAGRPLVEFAPNSPAAQAYRQLADVLTAEDRAAALASYETDPSPEADAETGDEVGTERDESDEEFEIAGPAGDAADEGAEPSTSAADTESDDVEPDSLDLPTAGADADGADAAPAAEGPDPLDPPTDETANGDEADDAADDSDSPAADANESVEEGGAEHDDVREEDNLLIEEAESGAYDPDERERAGRSSSAGDEADDDEKSGTGLFGRLAGVFR